MLDHFWVNFGKNLSKLGILIGNLLCGWLIGILFLTCGCCAATTDACETDGLTPAVVVPGLPLVVPSCTFVILATTPIPLGPSGGTLPPKLGQACLMFMSLALGGWDVDDCGSPCDCESVGSSWFWSCVAVGSIVAAAKPRKEEKKKKKGYFVKKTGTKNLSEEYFLTFEMLWSIFYSWRSQLLNYASWCFSFRYPLLAS